MPHQLGLMRSRGHHWVRQFFWVVVVVGQSLWWWGGTLSIPHDYYFNICVWSNSLFLVAPVSGQVVCKLYGATAGKITNYQLQLRCTKCSCKLKGSQTSSCYSIGGCYKGYAQTKAQVFWNKHNSPDLHIWHTLQRFSLPYQHQLGVVSSITRPVSTPPTRRLGLG